MANAREIKNGLRLKLGEISDGTWGNVEYGDSGEYVDEFLLAINLAQDDLARDIYTPENYLFTKTSVDKSIVTNATFYALPQDFIQMESLYHFRFNRSRPVLPGAIKNIRRDYNVSYSGYYTHYEVRGSINSYITQGVTSASSKKQLIDYNGNFAKVRWGDYVYNLTDGSEAKVVEFESGLIIIDKLQGGSRNEFAKDDSYAVATRESTQKMLFVDPPVTNTNSVLYEGSPFSFTPSKSGVIQEVYVTHNSLPQGWLDQDIMLYVIKDDHQNIITEWGQEEIKIGTNEIAFPPFQLDGGTIYHLFSSLESGEVIDVPSIRLELQSTDKLIVNYARRPRPLITDDSICEFPNECMTALYQGAANKLLEKISDDNVIPQILINRYEYEVQKLKEFYDITDESGSFEIGITADGQYEDYLPSHSDDYDWIDSSQVWTL